MSAAPRFSTADIAKGAQQPAEAKEAEAEAVEREQAMQREQTMQRERAEREIADRNERAAEREENVQRAEIGQQQNAVSAAPADATESVAPLFAQDAANDFRHRWDAIQASFVDDPRRAVREADSLVAETMQRLADTFAQERTRLEQRFESDRNVSTEDLRVTLRHYRSFFTRLLTV